MSAVGNGLTWLLALFCLLYELVRFLFCVGIGLVLATGVFAHVVAGLGNVIRPGRTEVRGLEAWARWFVS